MNQLHYSGDPAFAVITSVTGVLQAADPTQAPSAAATQLSGEPQKPAKYVNLQITMTGVDPLDSSAKLVWVKETTNHYSNFTRTSLSASFRTWLLQSVLWRKKFLRIDGVV